MNINFNLDGKGRGGEGEKGRGGEGERGRGDKGEGGEENYRGYQFLFTSAGSHSAQGCVEARVQLVNRAEVSDGDVEHERRGGG